MSIESVRSYFKTLNMEEHILEFPVSSATVALAAQAVGVVPARIAKTLSFYNKAGDSCILVVTSGDMKIDNSKFKKFFGFKAKMLSGDDVERLTGHEPGGVCPFSNPDSTEIYLDQSMERFSTVFPAAGSSNSAIELSCSQLQEYSHGKQWVDICKPINETI